MQKSSKSVQPGFWDEFWAEMQRGPKGTFLVVVPLILLSIVAAWWLIVNTNLALLFGLGIAFFTMRNK
jgi:hypothetical protein